VPTPHADIISKLRQDIHRLNGFKPNRQTGEGSLIVQPLLSAFPGNQFPLAALHEFISKDPVSRAATIGFVSVLLSAFCTRGPIIWISEKNRVFPPSLASFAIDPSRIIFIRAANRKDLLWTAGESMKCKGASSVICELKELDFDLSRKFQLAIEQSHVTAMILRESEPKGTTASIARWCINPNPSWTEDGLPGLGFPTWKINLLRVRNGKGKAWDLVYRNGRLQHVAPEILKTILPHRQSG
jgi:protein ImuA